MTPVRLGFPSAAWCWRANLMADSTASEPELTKNTASRPAGARPEIILAASTAAGLAADQDGMYASRSACSPIARAMSALPWPICTANSPARASRYRFPSSSRR